MIIIGVISDTYGLLRPEAVAALQGSDRIIHAGDVGAAEVLAVLSTLAPVTAVRGNDDHGSWARAIATTEVVPRGRPKERRHRGADGQHVRVALCVPRRKTLCQLTERSSRPFSPVVHPPLASR